MKAIIHPKYGAPDVLLLKEIETPVPKDNEVLIKVYAATVNRTDCAMLRAKPFIMRFFMGLFKPKRLTLGTDFAGKIEAVGKDVSSFKIGDKVFGFDDAGLSSHAQYLTISENNAIAIIPDNVDYQHAAASIEGGHYAYNFINKVEIKSGQKVLVNGATGAIGSASVQLLKYYGAVVTAVCDGKYADLIKSIGADFIIDYSKEDFTKSGGKYHFVFDTVGKSTFSKCKPILQNKGIYISSELGPMVQNPFLALITPLFGKKKVVFPMPVNRSKSVLLVKKLMEEGKFNPVIDQEYPLEETAKAFSYVETGQKIGNVVLLIN